MNVGPQSQDFGVYAKASARGGAQSRASERDRDCHGVAFPVPVKIRREHYSGTGGEQQSH